MLSSQGYSPSPTGYPSHQSNFNTVQTYPNQQNFLPQTLQDHSLHQGTDPNSPDVFKQNIQIVQSDVARLQDLARRALTGIQNAYHPGNSPAQTEADIAALKQSLLQLADRMRQTGVGALPLLPLPSGSDETSIIPTEQQMMTDTTHAVQVLYEKLKRSQESAANVANLLVAPEHGARTVKP